MKANIKLNGKTYSDFNEIKTLNEADSFSLYVTLLNDNYNYKDLTGKSTTLSLEFYEVKNRENNIKITGTVEDEDTAFLKFDLADEFYGKGYTIYKVFLRFENSTDSEKYNIFLGKLIITTDEDNFGVI